MADLPVTEDFLKLLSFLSLATPPDQRIADIGSGDGVVSRLVAATLKASSLHMVDPFVAPLPEEPACEEHYWRGTASDHHIRRQLEGQIDTVFSFLSVHEWENPAEEADHMLSLFPADGNGLIMIVDLCDRYWNADALAAMPDDALEHALDDLERVRQNRLLFIDDITAFWTDAFQRAGLEEPEVQVTPDESNYMIILPGSGSAWEELVEADLDFLPC